ncbi:MAG: transposase [Pseudomonadota bacterium]
MTMPRSALVSLSETSWYHVVSRCVRRAFLCGMDAHSGKNFEHRRGWIEARIMELASIFAIDVAAYAVMSNHYHLVLRIDAERARNWSLDEVLRRWTRLFAGPVLVQRFLSAERASLCQAEVDHVLALAEDYRARLHDLSWFMRVLNESIARQANAEDEVTGRFWEGRFKSQALLDEQAVLAAMAYVDLNPVRAGLAETPEASDFTSVKARLEAMRVEATNANDAGADAGDAPELALTGRMDRPPAAAPKVRGQASGSALLMPFDATGRFPTAVPFAFADYLELVDTLGRAVHPHKRGSIPEHIPAILGRLGVDAVTFMREAARLLKAFGSAVGCPARLAEHAAARNVRFLHGMRTARALFEPRKTA